MIIFLNFYFLRIFLCKLKQYPIEYSLANKPILGINVFTSIGFFKMDPTKLGETSFEIDANNFDFSYKNKFNSLLSIRFI